MRPAVLALLAWAVTGCAAASPPGPLPEGLTGTHWIAKSLAGREVPKNVAVTLEFPEPDRVAGRSGCNRYGGPIGVNEGHLVIGPLAMTRMACPSPQSEFETLFVAVADQALRLERDNNALMLIAEGQEPSRFLPFTPP
jgi:heat shock protein HslJ